MSPETIGRYKVVRELGRGAMGVVYQADDPALGRHVAVKTIHSNTIGTNPEEVAQRFKNEARAAGSLSHPNIVTVFDAGEQDGLLYLAMELLDGVTLEAYLTQQRTLPLEKAIDITRQICAALDYANTKGIIHRDIKPANIMLLSNGTVKITDFGLARTTEAITLTGHVMGTPHYMSPEQVRGRPVDGRSDLFSVGVMLYEMVTGERPFEGQSITTIMYKIVHENPTPPRALDSSIPPGLSAVIEKSMAKSPEERFQTGAELDTALENYKTFQSSSSASMTVDLPPVRVRVPQETSVPPPEAPGGNRRSLRNLAILAICIVMGTFVWLYSSRRNEQKEPANSAQQVQAPAPPPVPAASASPNNTTSTDASGPSKSGEVSEKQPATPGRSTAIVNVSSNPPTAVIYLDGKPTGLQTPAQLQLAQGDHEVSVRMEGFKPSSASFHIKGGENLEFAPALTVQLPNVPGVNMPSVNIPDIDLKKLAQLQQEKAGEAAFWQQYARAKEQNAQATPGEPSIFLNTRPTGASITVDGSDTGKQSPAIIPATVGKHHVRVQLDGYRAEERDVNVKQGRPAMVNIKLKAHKSQNP